MFHSTKIVKLLSAIAATEFSTCFAVRFDNLVNDLESETFSRDGRKNLGFDCIEMLLHRMTSSEREQFLQWRDQCPKDSDVSSEETPNTAVEQTKPSQSSAKRIVKSIRPSHSSGLRGGVEMTRYGATTVRESDVPSRKDVEMTDTTAATNGLKDDVPSRSDAFKWCADRWAAVTHMVKKLVKKPKKKNERNNSANGLESERVLRKNKPWLFQAFDCIESWEDSMTESDLKQWRKNQEDFRRTHGTDESQSSFIQPESPQNDGNLFNLRRDGKSAFRPFGKSTAQHQGSSSNSTVEPRDGSTNEPGPENARSTFHAP